MSKSLIETRAVSFELDGRSQSCGGEWWRFGDQDEFDGLCIYGLMVSGDQAAQHE